MIRVKVKYMLCRKCYLNPYKAEITISLPTGKDSDLLPLLRSKELLFGEELSKNWGVICYYSPDIGYHTERYKDIYIHGDSWEEVDKEKKRVINRIKRAFGDKVVLKETPRKLRKPKDETIIVEIKGEKKGGIR